MRRRTWRIETAPSSLASLSRIEDGVLVVYVPPDADDVTRRRLLDQAIRDHHWYYPHLPIPVPAPLRGHHGAWTSAAATAAVTLAAAGLTVYTTHPDGDPHIDGQITRQAPAAAPPAHTSRPHHTPTPSPTLTGKTPAPSPTPNDPSPITTGTPSPLPDLTHPIRAAAGQHPVQHAVGDHPVRHAVTPATGRHPIPHLLTSLPRPQKHPPKRTPPKLPCLPFQADCDSG